MPASPDNSPKPKIGAGHASAMMRLGLREWRNAFNPSRESVADTEMGLYGTRTPGEVSDIRKGNVWGDQQNSPQPDDTTAVQLAVEQDAVGQPVAANESQTPAPERTHDSQSLTEQGPEIEQGPTAGPAPEPPTPAPVPSGPELEL